MLARNNNFKIGKELCCFLYLYGSRTRKVMPITLQADSMNEKYAGFILNEQNIGKCVARFIHGEISFAA